MYTKRKVRDALTALSDSDYDMVVADLDGEAQEIVAGRDGRSEQALALARHFDAYSSGRSLSMLVDVIREIAPGAGL